LIIESHFGLLMVLSRTCRELETYRSQAETGETMDSDQMRL